MSALMRLRAKASRTSLRAPLVWARHLGLDSSDVFLASYPRSGNTLLRFPLAELLSRIPCSFENVQRIVPEIGVHVDAFPLLPGGGRLVKTHERYRAKYHRAIYIVRDVRDVLLSAFGRDAAMGLLDHSDLDAYIEPFMRGEMSRWGAWHDHIEEWLNSPLTKKGDLLLLRFEDIRSDSETALSRIAHFLGISADREAIQEACRNNSVEKMRAKEARSVSLPKATSNSGRLVNSGSVYGWQKKLNQEQLTLIESLAGGMLALLGYETLASRSGVS